ncbi:DUF2142 domain-containing protein [Ruminococcaceae bacterium OttesenSCG-928-I18]|nr:DUF2142 domain-containing protein [Ruminococcaceae bacterium OttesenSCG-928-I18]
MGLAEERKRPKLPVWAAWLIGYGCVLLLAVGLVYYWRVAFLLSELPAVPLTLGVAAVFSLLYLALFLLQRFCRQDINLKAALCVFLLGVLFCFANAPLQAPDESEYFLRANAIARGHFDYDYERGYPDDVGLLREHFPGMLNHRVQYEGHPLPAQALADYAQDLAAGEKPAEATQEPIIFMVLQFLPQALGIFLAKVLGFSALGQMYAARLLNLVCYTVLCYFAFRNCDKYRGVFFAFALLPLSLFMGASLSYDCTLLGLYYLMLSYFCKAEVHNRDVVVFGLAALLAALLKPTSIVLVAVLLLIPPARWKTKFHPWLSVGAMMALGVLLYFLMGRLNGLLTHNYPEVLPRGMGEEAAPATQIAFALSHLPAFTSRVGLTLYENAGFLFRLGDFGWMDLSIPLAGGLSLLSPCAASALGIQQKEDAKYTTVVALFLMALLYGGAVLAAMYFFETDLYSIRIVGVQPRYLLPAFLLLFMLASILLGKAVRPRLDTAEAAQRTETVTLWIACAVAFVSVILLFQCNFIGQWLPKAEGGWELVNLFGRLA